MTKSRKETDNARDTQYSIGHASKRILVRTTVANQLLRANQYEHACFGLPSPWSFPSRSNILLYAVVLPWLSLPRSISSLKISPLVSPSYAIPPRPGLRSSTCRGGCRKSEVVEKTPHPFFLLSPHGTHTLHEFPEYHALRQSRVVHARHKPREQDTPLAQYRLDALAPRLHEGVEILMLSIC